MLSSQRLLSGDSSLIQDDVAGMCPLDEEFTGEAAAYCSVFKKMYIVTNMYVHICSSLYFKTHRLASPMYTFVYLHAFVRGTNAIKFCVRMVIKIHTD